MGDYVLNRILNPSSFQEAVSKVQKVPLGASCTVMKKSHIFMDASQLHIGKLVKQRAQCLKLYANQYISWNKKWQNVDNQFEAKLRKMGVHDIIFLFVYTCLKNFYKFL